MPSYPLSHGVYYTPISPKPSNTPQCYNNLKLIKLLAKPLKRKGILLEANINGIRTNFEILGQGEPLLLLHGWRADSSIFQPISEGLSTKLRVITVDFPGFGRTDRFPRDWFLKNFTNFTENFLNYLGISKVYLAGHSFGGRVAIQLAANSSHRVRKLILIDSSGIKPKMSLKRLFYYTVAKIGKLVFSLPPLSQSKEKAQELLYKKVGESDYLTAGKMKKTFLNIINEDSTENLKKINTPTLILWGKNDTEIPLSDAYIMNKLIPNSNLSILENSGHFPFLEEPIEFIEKVTEFLIQESEILSEVEGMKQYK